MIQPFKCIPKRATVLSSCSSFLLYVHQHKSATYMSPVSASDGPVRAELDFGVVGGKEQPGKCTATRHARSAGGNRRLPAGAAPKELSLFRRLQRLSHGREEDEH